MYMVKKILLFGNAHSGTTILKSIINHSPNVYSVRGEQMKVKDIDIERCIEQKKEYVLIKYPRGYRCFFGKEYEDYIKIFIIRNPVYVFSSLNRRNGIHEGCNPSGNNSRWCEAADIYYHYLQNPKKANDINLHLIKYEDLFNNNYEKIKNIFDNMNFSYKKEIFNNTQYYNIGALDGRRSGASGGRFSFLKNDIIKIVSKRDIRLYIDKKYDKLIDKIKKDPENNILEEKKRELKELLSEFDISKEDYSDYIDDFDNLSIKVLKEEKEKEINRNSIMCSESNLHKIFNLILLLRKYKNSPPNQYLVGNGTFKLWQINQDFENNNFPSKICLIESQKILLENHFAYNYLYPNDFKTLFKIATALKKEYAMALKWYHKAAQQGCGASMNNIGHLYNNGHGVKQDYSKALVYFRKAAKGHSMSYGNSSALGNLGDASLYGEGVPKDETNTVDLLFPKEEA